MRKNIKKDIPMLVDVPIINNPLSFDGRIHRLSFFWSCTIASLLSIAAPYWLAHTGQLRAISASSPMMFLFLEFLCWLLFMLIALAATMKRLRDLKKDKWLGLFIFIPFASVLIWMYLLSEPSKYRN